MNTIIYWFRNDLRVHDNIILGTKLNSSQVLLPVFIIDDKLQEKHKLGFHRYGELRKIFLAESVIDLKENLKKLNSNLLIKFGDAAEIISKLANQLNADVVYATKEHTDEEIKLENRVSKNLGNVPLKFFEQSSLIHPDHLPFEVENLPDTFTEFRKLVEKETKIRSPFNVPGHLPQFPDLDSEDEINILADYLAQSDIKDPRSSFKFSGGESEGLNRLYDYIWKRAF